MDERAARLLAVHEPAGLRLARRRALTSRCMIPECDNPGALFPRGRLCLMHRPAQPTPGPPTRPTPEWIWPLEYGPVEP
jgi:hypothetical protein